MLGSEGTARAAEDVGRTLLEQRCARCHAIAADAKSPLVQAPNLWDTLRSHEIEMLEVELAEGIGSRHLAMPQIQFTSEEIEAVKAYLQVE
ncbi:MAG: cytochrome c [Hyphomicrobium sp.]|uniref:c-type cytochrome n=1 Tax=Hyphomicrobium sp. TaxID=82 RepID=UPI003D0C2321